MAPKSKSQTQKTGIILPESESQSFKPQVPRIAREVSNEIADIIRLNSIKWDHTAPY